MPRHAIPGNTHTRSSLVSSVQKFIFYRLLRIYTHARARGARARTHTLTHSLLPSSHPRLHQAWPSPQRHIPHFRRPIPPAHTQWRAQ